MNFRILACPHEEINNDNIYVQYKENYEDNKVRVVKIVHGLKIECRDTFLKKLKENEEIIKRFQLNIIRINRWWYSVYFK